MQTTTERLRNFLQYIAVNMIEDPKSAQLKIAELGPNQLRLKLVLSREDVAVLIGRNGFTIAAIRNMLKAIADADGCKVQLQIHSHEEEEELLKRGA
ncbi:MAG: KH domain-containing protein [Luteolibacter sp.]